MKIKPYQILKASKQVLSKRNYFIGFIVSILVVFLVFMALPVFLIPGNDLAFQLTIFKAWNYVLLFVLSVLTSLLIVTNVYMYREAKKAQLGKAAAGGSSAIFAGVFATAGCSSCFAALFGFLGVGAVFFLVKYQWFIVSLSIAIMLLSLYLTSLRFKGVCKNCK